MVNPEELDFDDRAVAVVVADGGEAWAHGGVDAEFFVEFTGEGGLGGFAGFDFTAGKFPFGPHRLVGAALAYQHFPGSLVVPEEEGGDDVTNGPMSCFCAAVQFTDGTLHSSGSVSRFGRGWPGVPTRIFRAGTSGDRIYELQG